jgi:hypothetical protein
MGTPQEKAPPLLLLHPSDNVFVARRSLGANEVIVVDGQEIRVRVTIPIGHKVARRELRPGARVLKYGAPIGSATSAIAPGDHVHLHNMKSDYLAPTLVNHST